MGNTIAIENKVLLENDTNLASDPPGRKIHPELGRLTCARGRFGVHTRVDLHWVRDSQVQA